MTSQPTLWKTWNEVLNLLQGMMTRATYQTWFAGSTLVGLEEERAVIGVRNEYAREWVANRLERQVGRALRAVVGRALAVEVVVQDLPSLPAGEGPVTPATAVANEGSFGFPGFEPFDANFVQMPRQFFEVVVPRGPAVVTAFVAVVAAKTIGVIVNYRTNERREWWEASYRDIERAAGMSVGSVGKAVRLSREFGYVVRGVGERDFTYRLRHLNEAVDDPELDEVAG